MFKAPVCGVLLWQPALTEKESSRKNLGQLKDLVKLPQFPHGLEGPPPHPPPFRPAFSI